MRIGDKVCKFISLYRSPNQSLVEFETFADNLRLTRIQLQKTILFLIVPLVDLDLKLSKGYENDSTFY